MSKIITVLVLLSTAGFYSCDIKNVYDETYEDSQSRGYHNMIEKDGKCFARCLTLDSYGTAYEETIGDSTYFIPGSDMHQEDKVKEAVYKVPGKPKNLVKAGGSTVWREVPCDNSPYYKNLVSKVQEALKDFGYQVGTVDNEMGPIDKAALIKFQIENGLPIGQMDLESLTALGVKY